MAYFRTFSELTALYSPGRKQMRSYPLHGKQMRSYPLHGKRRNLRRCNGCCVRAHMSFWRAILKRSVLALLFSALWPEAPMLSSSFHSVMFCPG